MAHFMQGLVWDGSSGPLLVIPDLLASLLCFLGMGMAVHHGGKAKV